MTEKGEKKIVCNVCFWSRDARSKACYRVMGVFLLIEAKRKKEREKGRMVVKK